MKIFSLSFCFFGVGLLHGEERGEVQRAGSFIPGSLAIPEFTPPAPVVPKQVPARRVDASVTLPTASGRTLTVIRGEASTLPDIPEPPQPRASVPRLRTAEDLAREAWQRRHTLQMGATVLDHRISVVRWQHPDTGEDYEAVCGFDIGLLAGTGRFVRDGEDYLLMLMHSNYSTRNFRNLAAQLFPKLPEVTAGAIVFTKGNSQDAVGIAPITLLQELIASEKPRLAVYQADRLRHQQAREAWEKSHPEAPRDETIWLKPHRGSRYLATPRPEAQ
jgi:hypothetical protein